MELSSSESSIPYSATIEVMRGTSAVALQDTSVPHFDEEGDWATLFLCWMKVLRVDDSPLQRKFWNTI